VTEFNTLCTVVYREIFSVFRVISDVKSLATFGLVGNIPHIAPGLTFRIPSSIDTVHVRFFGYIKTNSDYFPIQRQLIGFYNRKEACSLSGTN